MWRYAEEISEIKEQKMLEGDENLIQLEKIFRQC